MKLRPLLYLSLPALTAGTALANIDLDFSSFGTAAVNFQGATDSIVFSPDISGFDFKISKASLAGLNGLNGKIEGNFTIGNVTLVGAGLQTAPVKGSGTFSIFDGVSSFFTAKVWWGDALTVGTVGALNTEGASNVSNFSYSGSNADLLTLAASTAGTDVVSFQFATPKSLSQLIAGNSVNSTSYSGSLSTVPEPATYAAILGGIALLTAMFQRRRLEIV